MDLDEFRIRHAEIAQQGLKCGFENTSDKGQLLFAFAYCLVDLQVGPALSEYAQIEIGLYPTKLKIPLRINGHTRRTTNFCQETLLFYLYCAERTCLFFTRGDLCCYCVMFVHSTSDRGWVKQGATECCQAF